MERVPDELVRFAHRLADAAGAAIRPHFRNAEAELKPDDSPVTAADRGAEAAIMELVAGHFPGHGVRGEEFPPVNPDAEWVWVVDPIDGTKSFVAGIPLFATLLALDHGGTYVLGLIDQPMLAERWTGAAGLGATMNGRPVSTRACADLACAIVTTFGSREGGTIDYDRQEPLHRAGRYAMYGGEGYDYALLAAGGHDVMVDKGLKEHDWAGPAALVESAGGHVCDWQGRRLGRHSDGSILAVGDPRMAEPCLALLAA